MIYVEPHFRTSLSPSLSPHSKIVRTSQSSSPHRRTSYPFRSLHLNPLNFKILNLNQAIQFPSFIVYQYIYSSSLTLFPFPSNTLWRDLFPTIFAKIMSLYVAVPSVIHPARSHPSLLSLSPTKWQYITFTKATTVFCHTNSDSLTSSLIAWPFDGTRSDLLTSLNK